MSPHKIALTVDYYRTAIGWQQVIENGDELDEPRNERRRRP
jgi:hypothetical protein